MELPKPIERLIGELSRFPGVGRRSAERMAMDIVLAGDRIEGLVDCLRHVHEEIGVSDENGYFTVRGEELLTGPERQHDRLLVVERPSDVISIEKAGGFRGLYHVLGGHLSPLKGIGPGDLRMEKLFERLASDKVEELILATSPSVEGDATALYIARHVERDGLRISRLGRGIPMGGSLEFADSSTLRMAIEARQTLDPK